MEKDLIYSYDKKRDVLYVSIGEPKEAIANEIADEIFIQLDPKNKQVVGFTIVNFEKQFIKSAKNKHPSFHVPVRAEFRLAQKS